MKIYTSYFYKLRFFKRNMIPLSTAVWDPKWFHAMTGDPKHQFKDKNGVYNGLRAEPFNPPPGIGGDCGKNCGQLIPCNFMAKYREYLDSLNFDDILARCERIAQKVQEKEGFEEEPIIVLMVHEPITCKCAERPVIHEWFAAHGHPIEELEVG